MTTKSGHDNSRNLLHLKMYKEDPEKGRVIYPWGDERGVTTLLLTVKGRKSGKLYTTPLIYKKVGGTYVVIASLGGAPNHPDWYLNLVANPDCHIQVGHDHLDVVAKTVEGAQREFYWNEAIAQYPDYVTYQGRTERRLPVVALTPTTPQ